MKIAIVGSQTISGNIIEEYVTGKLLINITEIVTGGAKGVDSAAVLFAKNNNIPLTIFVPEYSRFKKGAPLKRNELIAEYSDEAYIFWNGKSKGTQHIINCFKKLNKKVTLFVI